MAETTWKGAPEELEALIIGAGFSGVYQLYRLRQRGFNVRVHCELLIRCFPKTSSPRNR